MPSLVVISGGESLSVLKEIVTVNLSPTDRVVTLMSNVKEFYRSVSLLYNYSQTPVVDGLVLQVFGHVTHRATVHYVKKLPI